MYHIITVEKPMFHVLNYQLTNELLKCYQFVLDLLNQEVVLLKIGAGGERGTQVSQSTLDFSLGLDLRVMTSSPALGSTLGIKPTLKNKEKNSNNIRGNERTASFKTLLKNQF